MTDPAALLDRLRDQPGEIECVLLGSGLADPVALASEIRSVDPSVDVVLCGSRGAPSGEASPSLSAFRARGEAERLAGVTRLAAGIAHDLATPLTAILGYADLLGKSILDPKSQRRAATIAEQVRRMRELLDAQMDLLLVSEGVPRPLDLVPLVDRALDLTRDRLRRRQMTIERHYLFSPRIYADPVRLSQALLSALLWAGTAVPRSGATLAVTIAEARAGVALRFCARPVAPEEVDPPVEGPSVDLELRALRAIVRRVPGSVQLLDEGSGKHLVLQLEIGRAREREES